MKYLFSLLIVLSLSLVFSCSQGKENSERNIDGIYQLQQKANTISKDSLSYYISKLKPLFQTIHQLPDSIVANQEYLLGNYFHATQKDSAIYHYNQAIIHSGNLKEKNYFLTLALYYKKNGDYLNSISVLEKMEALVSADDYTSLAHINNQRQSIYKLLKNYKASLNYNQKAIRYFARAKDTNQLVNSLIVKSNMMYHYFNDKKQAYRLLDSVLTIPFNHTKDHNILHNQVHQCYGIFNFYDKNFPDAYIHYVKALSYLQHPQTRSDSLGLANTYANITEVCTVLKRYDLAAKYTDSVGLYANVLNDNLRKFHLQNQLQLAFDSKQNFDHVATEFDRLYGFMNETYEKRINKELTALKEANENERKLLIANQKSTLKNYQLRKKQWMLFGISGILALSVLIGFLYYRQKQLKHEKDEIFMQQRLFRAQMNPHFTSNILYSIQNLIKEDSVKANKYLVKFSRLLRLNLENSMQDYTSIEKEIEVVAKYLDLQQLRYPDLFEYHIETIDVDEEFQFIPPMLIQPFVENAIKHGFKNIDYLGQIDIVLSMKNNLVFCQITDNGIGMQPKKESFAKNNAHTSASTRLIKQLIYKLTKTEVEIKKAAKGGTLVQFYIPYRDEG